MSIYSWGANSHGQLGLGFESELCNSPQRITRLPFNINVIKSIKGGGGHVLILDKDGQLYSCGWNNKGQLGLDCTEDKNELQLVSSDFFDGAQIDEIACGWDTSGAITKTQQLYIWGSNSFEQLGLCKRGFGFVARPFKMNFPKNEIPIRLSFGLRHICVLTKTNKIFVFGRFRHNIISSDITYSMVPFNQHQILKIQPNLTVDIISSGQNHFLITDRSRVIGIGDNKYGQSNTFVSENRIKNIVTGWTHNGILTTSNEVFLWGRNSYGQIGCSNQQSFPSPVKLDLSDNHVPIQLHLGAEHGLILTNNGNIITWGWNEHGNCGNGDTENLYTPTIVKLPANCIMAGTGAGFCYAVCAT